MIATTIATPSAAPTWRATEFIPVAAAKLSPGAEATAVPLRLGNSVPAPRSRRRGGHHHRDDRADTEGQASLQDRVSPYAREEQDVH